MQHYFITGVSAGIGKALAEELLSRLPDAIVHGCARRDPNIQNSRFHFHAVDFEKQEALFSFAQEFLTGAFSDASKIVLINNAGILGDIGFAGQLDAKHYQHVFAINCIAPMVLMEEFLKHYQFHTAEKLVFNISSGAAQKDIEGWAAYCASKAALDRFTTVTAKEQSLQQHPVDFFTVSPGVVDTAMQAQIRTATKEQLPTVDRFLSLHQSGDLLSVQVVASRLYRLLQDRSLRNSPFLSVRED